MSKQIEKVYSMPLHKLKSKISDIEFKLEVLGPDHEDIELLRKDLNDLKDEYKERVAALKEKIG